MRGLFEWDDMQNNHWCQDQCGQLNVNLRQVPAQVNE